MSELEINDEDFALIERALGEGGVPYTLDELENHPECAEDAFRVAAETLPQITTSFAIGNFARALADLPDPGDSLIEAFRLIRPFIVKDSFAAKSHAWGVAEALRTKAKARHVDPILELLQDRAYGRARQMLPYPLTRFKRKIDDILPVLISLLDDETMIGQVVDVLGRLKEPKAIPHIVPFLDHDDWGKGARKALRKLGYDLGADLDAEALASYRDRASEINRTSLAHYTISGPPETIWSTLIPLFESGYGAAEARNLMLRAEEMEVEESDVFGFTVAHQAVSSPLLIELFMDDVDVPDVTFWAPQPVVTGIEGALESFL